MSGPMILGGTSLHAVSRGIEADADADDYDAFRLGQGLGFFRWGVVDQHFLQRGRIGRLLIAARASGEQLAFGVDENSALLVCGDRGEVVGETGVLFIDLRRAVFDTATSLSATRAFPTSMTATPSTCGRGRPLPATDKRRTRVTRSSYRRPAPVRRNAFASYGLHDLMLRLVEGDPAFYARDSASAFDPLTGNQVTLEVQRQARRSRALRGIRRGEIRYTALNFRLDVRRVALDACPLAESTQVLRPDPVPEARLVLLGSAPVRWPTADATPCAANWSSRSASWPRRRESPRRWPSAISTG
jgi:hypothetical protein